MLCASMVLLPVSVPLFLTEALGYRGGARFVALRWVETNGDLWMTDDGHTQRGLAQSLALLWRRPGGEAALERYRIEIAESGSVPWLLIDRKEHRVSLGDAASVWSVIEAQARDSRC